MEVKFSTFSKRLSIDNLSKIKVISFDDYGKYLQSNINFPSGAHEMRVILGRVDSFISAEDFFRHICSIPYARCTHFDLPNDFEDRKFTFEPINKKEMDKYINAYIEGFFEHLYPISVALNLWKLTLNLDDFIVGYKVEVDGTEQVLVCKTSEYYLYFISQSID